MEEQSELQASRKANAVKEGSCRPSLKYLEKAPQHLVFTSILVSDIHVL